MPIGEGYSTSFGKAQNELEEMILKVRAREIETAFFIELEPGTVTIKYRIKLRDF